MVACWAYYFFLCKIFPHKRTHNYIQEIFYGSNHWRTMPNLWSEFAIIALLKLELSVQSAFLSHISSISNSSLSFFFSLLFHSKSCYLSFFFLQSSRGTLAFGGWHGGWRWVWAWRVYWGPTSLSVALLPLPGASCLPPQECLSRWPSRHGFRLWLRVCGWGQAKPQQ